MGGDFRPNCRRYNAGRGDEKGKGLSDQLTRRTESEIKMEKDVASRRIFTRFEKTAKNFAGMLKMAFIHRSLRLLYQ
jgi:hypothetical protein